MIAVVIIALVVAGALPIVMRLSARGDAADVERWHDGLAALGQLTRAPAPDLYPSRSGQQGRSPTNDEHSEPREAARGRPTVRVIPAGRAPAR